MTGDLQVICRTSTKVRRHVSRSDHDAAYTSYGYAPNQPRGRFEVDHLIPLELGGDNTLANLWAQATEPRPGRHEKDRVENFLHHRVCTGELELREAQEAIATDWLQVWRKMTPPQVMNENADDE